MDIEIKKLTPHLAQRIRVQAALAFNGKDNHTCDLETMKRTCFASENCAGGFSGMDIDSLVTQPICLVAVVEKEGGAVDFVGCVTAATATTSVPRYFPNCVGLEDSILLSNLCVDERYRRRKVGERLCQAVCAYPSKYVYLFVSKGYGSKVANTHEIFRDRVERLTTMYPKIGFQQCDECKHCILMRYDPGWMSNDTAPTHDQDATGMTTGTPTQNIYTTGATTNAAAHQ